MEKAFVIYNIIMVIVLSCLNVKAIQFNNDHNKDTLKSDLKVGDCLFEYQRYMKIIKVGDYSYLTISNRGIIGDKWIISKNLHPEYNRIDCFDDIKE